MTLTFSSCFAKLSSFSIASSLMAMGCASAEVSWVPGSSREPLPRDALFAGRDGSGPNEGVPLYVCRAIFEDSLHPGKLIGGNCNVPYGGHEHEVSRYEVAVSTDGAWGPPRRDYAGALIGGYEPGRTLFVCRARYVESASRGYYDRGVHPGKVVGDKCNFGWGGQEIQSTSDFEVFYPERRPRDHGRDRRDHRRHRD